ncbi:hypothetical protein HDV00_002689 [Rhizophlyctis rosea]|nr:hypothetical protein HDV00_002689 [Rhizophlyctis rosea]
MQTIMPKIDRGFFIAEGEWTCYRRNYFQVSAAFECIDLESNLTVDLPCLMIMNPPHHPDVGGSSSSTMTSSSVKTITHFAMSLSARVANGTKPISVVQHTPKRDKGPQRVPGLIPCLPGGNPHAFSGVGVVPVPATPSGDSSSSMSVTPSAGTSSIATFDRCQFKTATANNGRRRASQQFYVLVLEVWGICGSDASEGGDSGPAQYKIATTESAPLVVRGRSPGHYGEEVDPRLLMVEGPAGQGRGLSMGGGPMGLGLGGFHPDAHGPNTPSGSPHMGTPQFTNAPYTHTSHRFEPYGRGAGGPSMAISLPPHAHHPPQPQSPYSPYSASSSHSGLDSPMSGVEGTEFRFPQQPLPPTPANREYGYMPMGGGFAVSGADVGGWNGGGRNVGYFGHPHHETDASTDSVSPSPPIEFATYGETPHLHGGAVYASPYPPPPASREHEQGGNGAGDDGRRIDSDGEEGGSGVESGGGR